MSNRQEKYKTLFICLGLVLATLLVYRQVQNCEFVHYDDDQYVTGNPHIRAGLTAGSFRWAFTAAWASNWHPLTWLSHMLDCELFGLNPRWHHTTSLLFHLANTLLLFLVLRSMTGSISPSAFVAAAFALHPLHVESVAWISERKDVLSTLFWLLTMAAYLRYVKRPAIGRYLLTLISFVLGLLAKPMLVTLPFVLLLLDYWPLGRIQISKNATAAPHRLRKRRQVGTNRKSQPRVVLEKIPFFALSLLSSAVTFFVQKQSGTVAQVGLLPLKIRLANAAVSYTKYIARIIWPSRLAVFYPLDDKHLSIVQALAAVVLLAGITICIIRLAPKYRCLLTGWFWFLGTLVPVIGLVQVGAQAMADRYTYIPSIGLFIMVAWAVPALVPRLKYRKIIFGISSLVVLSALTAGTYLQLKYWRNSLALFSRALAVTNNNSKMHNNLGLELHLQGQTDRAVSHFRRAIEIKPDYANACNNLGNALKAQGKLDEALNCFQRAVRLKPNHVEAQINLALLLQSQDRLAEAAGHFRRAIELRASSAELHNNLGITMAMQGRLDDAVRHCSRALQLNPDYPEAYYNLGNALKLQGKLESAAESLRRAVQLKPGFAEAHYSLGRLLNSQGKVEQALNCYKQALRTRPNWPAPLKALTEVLAVMPNPDRQDVFLAVALAERAAGLTGRDDVTVLETLAMAYACAGQPDKAVAVAEEALRLASESGKDEPAGQIREKLEAYRQAVK